MGSGSGSYRRCFTGHRIRSRIVLTIGPAEDCLDSIMEAAQGNRARDLDTPPDWRLDAEEGNFELVDGWLGFGGGHKAYCRPRRAPAALSANRHPGHALGRAVLALGRLQGARRTPDGPI